MLSIIVPVYNEEKAITSTVGRLKEAKKQIKQNSEIILVNDGSTDKTKNIISKIKGVKIISHPYNLGYGAAIKSGIKAAKGDWVLITDADATYPIEDIPRLVRYTNQYDMVVGARTGKRVYVPLLRRPAKRIITILANVLSRRRIPDINSGFRIFKKEIAERFFNLFPSGFSFTTTLTLASICNDYTVKYIPINYFKREGKSSIHPVRDFFGFITLIARIIMYFEPLKFFLFPGLLLIIISVVLGIVQYGRSGGIGEAPILFVLVGIVICFLGLIADLIVKKSK